MGIKDIKEVSKFAGVYLETLKHHVKLEGYIIRLKNNQGNKKCCVGVAIIAAAYICGARRNQSSDGYESIIEHTAIQACGRGELFWDSIRSYMAGDVRYQAVNREELSPSDAITAVIEMKKGNLPEEMFIKAEKLVGYHGYESAFVPYNPNNWSMLHDCLITGQLKM